MRTAAGCAAVALLAAGCELTEVTLAEPRDVIIAEVVLRARASTQTAYLHRTVSGGSLRVAGATIVVTDEERGTTLVYDEDDEALCLNPAPEPGTDWLGTCYVARGDPTTIREGARYTVRIDLPGGGVLSGATRVPGEFEITRPRFTACRLSLFTRYELTWTRSPGASVYLAETRLDGIRQALRQGGLDIPGDGSLTMTALGIGASDTTMTFPSDFGIFDRFEEGAFDVLVAIQRGLPPGVRAPVVVAAADPNYVNWARGGSFNPSGLVRISSLTGAGRGVFGSMAVRQFELRTTGSLGVPVCNTQ